jgi:hypothetical protein
MVMGMMQVGMLLMRDSCPDTGNKSLEVFIVIVH